MKTFKNLFYAGISLILIPIIILVSIYYLSKNDSDRFEKAPKQKIVYDTIHVKVYDTVVIQKIKYITKVKKDSLEN